MSKRTKNKSQRLKEAQANHENWLKSIGYKGGKSLRGKHGRRIGINDIPNLREGLNSMPPTSDKVAGNGSKKESQKYTGDYVKGIATTHKSNLMPVTSKKQAIQASQMRRS